MPKRSYTSDAGADEAVSTKGISFDLDGVTFECDGLFDPNDMMDLAVELQDATPERADPSAIATVGYLIRAIMGEETWQAFRAHRRKHHTRPEVIAQIMNGLVEDITDLPTPKPSPSPGGRQPTGPSSPAALPSPERAYRRRRPVKAVDPEGIIPPDTPDGDIITAPPPAAGSYDEGPPVRRTISLKTGKVTVEDLAG